ncbi:MAG: XRE family transcriptional regulator [Hydrogenophaga sp.]|nr:XRE family transcriptional regulator [Hydrogenophaga sp.]
MDKKNPAQQRRENLKRWMDSRTVSSSDLARRIGSGRAYVSLLFREDRHFGEKAARSIEASLGLPDGWLDATSIHPSTVSEWASPDDLDPEVFALVPRIEVSLSAGSGSLVNTEQQLPPLAFRRDWLRKKGVTSRDNLRLCEIRGQSMEPGLMDGDIAMIDLGQRQVKDGEVYAVRFGDELRIKRLFKTLDGGLRLHSDNPNFPDELISPAGSGLFEVLGLKLWRCG